MVNMQIWFQIWSKFYVYIFFCINMKTFLIVHRTWWTCMRSSSSWAAWRTWPSFPRQPVPVFRCRATGALPTRSGGCTSHWSCPGVRTGPYSSSAGRTGATRWVLVILLFIRPHFLFFLPGSLSPSTSSWYWNGHIFFLSGLSYFFKLKKKTFSIFPPRCRPPSTSSWYQACPGSGASPPSLRSAWRAWGHWHMVIGGLPMPGICPALILPITTAGWFHSI